MASKGVYRRYTMRRVRRKNASVLMYASSSISTDIVVEIESLVAGSVDFVLLYESGAAVPEAVSTDKLTQFESTAPVSTTSQSIGIESTANALTDKLLQIEALTGLLSNPEDPRNLEIESLVSAAQSLVLLIESRSPLDNSLVLLFETGSPAGVFVPSVPTSSGGGSLTNLTNITAVVM